RRCELRLLQREHVDEGGTGAGMLPWCPEQRDRTVQGDGVPETIAWGWGGFSERRLQRPASGVAVAHECIGGACPGVLPRRCDDGRWGSVTERLHRDSDPEVVASVAVGAGQRRKDRPPQ